MNTLKEHMLYSDIIEDDGHLAKEPTFLGAMLIAIAAAAILFFVLPYVFSFL
jgi:hypothetical protein